MNFSGRQRRNLLIFLPLSLAGTVAGGAYAVLTTTEIDGPMPDVVLRGLLTGFVISVVCIAYEIAMQTLRFLVFVRRLPLAASHLMRTAVFMLCTWLGLVLGDRLLPWPPEAAPGLFHDRTAFWFAFAAAFTVSLMLEMARLLGTKGLVNFVTGRYGRPRREERIFLFADVKGSTAIAERIGDIAFHRFLNTLFFELTEPILAWRGEIYRYVGDEVIVSWPIEDGVCDAACLRCAMALQARTRAVAPKFIARYGVAPAIRCALHAGPAVVGEMGDVRKEITFLGDTVNTTARLANAARTLGAEVLLSEELAVQLPPTAEIPLVSFGAVECDGKSTPVPVVGVRALSDENRLSSCPADRSVRG